MTEQELLDQKAKLKAMYTQTANTTRNNSKAEFEADKASYTNTANSQLGEQKATTNTTIADADINAFNNAKKLRELAASGGFSNGGELLSGTIQQEQQKGTQIGNANNNFARYKKDWDGKLNEYNTKWNNNMNKLNSETDNALNEYNTKLDMEYNGKIESLRAQMAQAAAASRSSGGSSRSSGGSKSSGSTSGMTKTELYDYRLRQLNDYMDNKNGYGYLIDNKTNLLNELGQTSYDKLKSYYDKNASTGEKDTVASVANNNSKMTTSMFHPVDAPTTKAKPASEVSWWKDMVYGRGNY